SSGASSAAPAVAGGSAASPAASSARGAAPAAAGAGASKQPGVQGPASGSISDLLAKKAIFGGNENCAPATGTPVLLGNVSTLSGVLGELFSRSCRPCRSSSTLRTPAAGSTATRSNSRSPTTRATRPPP